MIDWTKKLFFLGLFTSLEFNTLGEIASLTACINLFKIQHHRQEPTSYELTTKWKSTDNRVLAHSSIPIFKYDIFKKPLPYLLYSYYDDKLNEFLHYLRDSNNICE